MLGLLPIFVPFQVIFEPTEGATPNSLRQFVSGVCNIPLDRLNIAKYFRQKYDWLVISDSFSRQVCTLIQFMKTQCQCHRKRQLTLRYDKYFAIIELSMEGTVLGRKTWRNRRISCRNLVPTVSLITIPWSVKGRREALETRLFGGDCLNENVTSK